MKSESVIRSVVFESLQLYELYPARLLCPCNSPSVNTGVCCCSLLQGIFLPQRLNPGLLNGTNLPYHLSHQGSQFCAWQKCYISELNSIYTFTFIFPAHGWLSLFNISFILIAIHLYLALEKKKKSTTRSLMDWMLKFCHCLLHKTRLKA